MYVKLQAMTKVVGHILYTAAKNDITVNARRVVSEPFLDFFLLLKIWIAMIFPQASISPSAVFTRAITASLSSLL